MSLQVFSVYDDAAKAFLRPFFVPSKGLAIRGFLDACSDKSHEFSRHAGDYTLFHLGDFDESTAEFKCLKVPSRVASALELLPGGKTDDLLVV